VIITENGGQSQYGSCLWYHGETMPDDLFAEFDEDASTVLKDFAHNSTCSEISTSFAYCSADIDMLSEYLGIPWEPAKTVPFTEVVPFLG
jgi:hypothetical protein